MPVLSDRRKERLWDLLLANLTLVATFVATVLRERVTERSY